jgi:hypothetical protein
MIIHMAKAERHLCCTGFDALSLSDDSTRNPLPAGPMSDIGMLRQLTVRVAALRRLQIR